jgi:dolichyl-phosphate beta-glucosyltransferase
VSAKIDLTIIMPAYMEAGTIKGSLQELARWLDSRNYGEVEVLVVTADSPDGTADIAREQKHLFQHFRVINLGARVGKGRDVREGMFEARGRYRLFMDADLATPLVHLDDVKRFMDDGGEIAVAVRNLWRIHKGFARKLISKTSNIAAQILVTPGIKDTQCGFKVFRADVAEDVFARMTMLSWSFDAEILLIARERHYTITPIEAPDWADPKAEGLGLVGDNPIKAALNGFIDLWVMRWNAIRGFYRRRTYRHHSIS